MAARSAQGKSGRRPGRHDDVVAVASGVQPDGMHAVTVAAAPVGADRPGLVARIERALVLLAYLIELDGDIHIPLYEKLETELEALLRTEDTKSCARQRLAGYSRSGGLNAIRCNTLSLSSSEGPLPYFGL